MLKYFK